MGLFKKSNQLPYVFWLEHLVHWHLKWVSVGQCSCLETPRDGEAWWPAVYGVAQGQTRLKWLSSSSSSSRPVLVILLIVLFIFLSFFVFFFSLFHLVWWYSLLLCLCSFLYSFYRSIAGFSICGYYGVHICWPITISTEWNW